MQIRALNRFLLFAAIAFGCAGFARGQTSRDITPRESPARGEVEKLIQKSGGEVAVAFRMLDGSQELFLQADAQFETTNINKIPVMIELYAEAQEGELRLSDPVTVHNDFRIAADGTTYRVDPKNDPDPDVYKSIGKTMTLEELCEQMISHGSVLAANLLIERIGPDKIQQQMRAVHGQGDSTRSTAASTMSDGGLSSTTSARGLMEVLWALANGDAVSPDASQEMIGILARSNPAQAGASTSGANALRSAGISGTHQEAMIIYGPHPYVVVILVRGIADDQMSSALIAQIIHTLAATP